ncbi:unnamed protein product [Calicophoron daubneyi]|uniref:BPTI/Kunitz inhibitor domain-containing protein n=1 Tax=Calicophoron daubneyi TaxID=300641 RepID=A0AAV2TE68_CALDB
MIVHLIITALATLVYSQLGTSETVCASCSRPIDSGPCYGFFPRYAYNGKKCVLFMYGGCRGNSNRFLTKADCKIACEKKPKEIMARLSDSSNPYKAKNIPELCRELSEARRT